MIDQASRIETLVKGELTRASVALGIDKTTVGFYVTKSFAPVQAQNGETGLFLCWVVGVTLRVPLLGYPAIDSPVLLPAPPGTLPTDDGFCGTAKAALEEANRIYQNIMEQSKEAAKGLGKYGA